MATACDPVIGKYLDILRSDFAILEADDGCRLVTPYYRPDGDAIEVVLKDLGDGQLRFSDDGQTLNFLFISGLNVERNKSLLDEAIAMAQRRGASLVNSEIFLDSHIGTEGESLGKLISAIESITYLIYRRQHREFNPFADEVFKYLADNQIDFLPTHKLPGTITPEHTVPIYINSSKNLVVEPLSATSAPSARAKAEHLYYEVTDIHSKMPKVRFAGIIDDREEERAEFWSDSKARAITKAILTDVFVWDKRSQLLSFVREL